MFGRLFTDHPNTVGETYIEHLGQAFGFGLRMILAGIACLFHGMVPAWFVKTGSRTISHLHDRMVRNRSNHRIEAASACDFVI